METLKIQVEYKFLDSIQKWVCTMFVPRGEGKQSLYASGHFHKAKEKAHEAALEDIKRQLAFHREIETESEKSVITMTI